MSTGLCLVCGHVMDPWLADNGYERHVLCEGKPTGLDLSRRAREGAADSIDKAKRAVWALIQQGDTFTSDDVRAACPGIHPEVVNEALLSAVDAGYLLPRPNTPGVWLPASRLDPPAARSGDPDTSKQAADMISRRRTMQERLLAVIAETPATAHEAAQVAGYGPGDGAWKRVSDLSSAGLIRDSGIRRQGPSGRNQIVWEVVS